MLMSPLRYPGGKAKLYDYFTYVIKTNNLYHATYCEPYAGGAGLAIRLLSNGFVERVALNDVDYAIYCFWKSVLSNTDAFCALIENKPVTIDEWYNQNRIWKAACNFDILTVGYATFFLNRTNRSGIIDGAGPIGGYKQEGRWKIDVRFNKKALLGLVAGIARLRSQIDFSNIDAAKFIPKQLRADHMLMYLDPPYYVKGSKLYKNYYNHSDHIIIHNLLLEHRSANWIVSYDDVVPIRKLYHEFQPIDYKLHYSAGTKAMGSEVMYFSDSLRTPDRTRIMKVA